MSWNAIEKARRRLSREQGTVLKDWGGRLPVAIVYPNSYYLGMSNLGIHALYRLLNSYGNVVGERVFWEKENEAGLPLLSLESQRPLSDFAVLAFSISYELDYFNTVHILKASGIPLYAAERNESHPIIISGGPCIIANPLPLSPFFDCLCIGEAEVILPPMLDVLKDNSTSRNDKLKSLSKLPGVYVPLLHSGGTVARQWVKDLDSFPVASAVLTRDTELGGMYLIEVERGCHWQCRFCLTCNAFRPVRSRSIETLVARAEVGLQYRKRLGLVGADVSDYPHLDELVARLSRIGAQISVSSLRIKPLSTTLLREMVRGGSQSIALAPEAGSQRLRDVIRKGITEDDILAAVAKVAEEQVRQVKLYFMIGLPTETDEDIEAIIDLTLQCSAILEKKRSKCRIVLNISPFVPKAGTPFQWLPMESVPVLEKRLSLLKSSLPSRGIEVKEESPAWSEVQVVLARGDAKLAKVLANVDKVSLAEWRKALDKCGLDADFYAHQRWNTEEKLPWWFIDSGVDKGRLEGEMEGLSNR